MNKIEFGKNVFAIAIIAAIAAAVFGWVMNIVNLFGMIDASIDAEFVLRLVGVFVAPLGAILGYF